MKNFYNKNLKILKKVLDYRKNVLCLWLVERILWKWLYYWMWFIDLNVIFVKIIMIFLRVIMIFSFKLDCRVVNKSSMVSK